MAASSQKDSFNESQEISFNLREFTLALETVSAHELQSTVRKSLHLTRQDSEGNTILHRAIKNGELKLVEFLLQYSNQWNVNLGDRDGKVTPFILATKYQRIEIIKLFLSQLPIKGIDFNAKDVFGNTAFHHACKVGSLEVVEIFLNSPRIDYNALNNAEESGIISSFYNVKLNGTNNYEVMELLLEKSLEKSIDVNAKDMHGNTAFLRAVRYGLLEAVELFVKYASNIVDINESNKAGQTALDIAYYHPKPRTIFKVLVDTALDTKLDLNAKDNYGDTVLHQACTDGNMEVVSFLLDNIDKGINVNAKNNGGCTPFIAAFHYGHHHIVNHLLHSSKDKKIDVNVTNDHGQTVLHLCAMTFDNIMLRILLEHARNGLKIDVKDDVGCTALHYACKKGHYKILESFLMNPTKVDFNAQDHQGMTAFYKVFDLADTEMVKLFLKRAIRLNIDLNTTDDNGMTPFQKACLNANGTMLKLMIKNPGGINFNAQTNDGKTGFHLACSHGRTNFVKLLLANAQELQIDICLPESTRQYTPFHSACLLESKEIVEAIVKHAEIHGIDIKATDRQGLTPLHYACSNGYLEVVEYLVQYCQDHGIDVMVPCHRGYTPLQYAAYVHEDYRIANVFHQHKSLIHKNCSIANKFKRF